MGLLVKGGPPACRDAAAAPSAALEQSIPRPPWLRNGNVRPDARRYCSRCVLSAVAL